MDTVTPSTTEDEEEEEEEGSGVPDSVIHCSSGEFLILRGRVKEHVRVYGCPRIGWAGLGERRREKSEGRTGGGREEWREGGEREGGEGGEGERGGGREGRREGERERYS